ncbi:1145_t:CDS:2, partial [Ambispora gerdemannii]
ALRGYSSSNKADQEGHFSYIKGSKSIFSLLAQGAILDRSVLYSSTPENAMIIWRLICDSLACASTSGADTVQCVIKTSRTQSMSLSNLRTFAYTILKNLNDEAVNDHVQNVKMKLLRLSTNHSQSSYVDISSIESIEKNFLLTQSNVCPISGCNSSVEPVVSEQRNSQSSGTSDLADRLGDDLKMNTPRITNDPMNISPLLGGGNRDIDPILFESGVQKKRIMEEDSPILKRLIQELSTDGPEDTVALQTESASETNTTSVNFLNLYQKIVDAEGINKKTSQDVIRHYFHFGKAIDERCNHYRKGYPKRTSEGKVGDDIRKQIPNSISESLLRKTKERALKIYDIFNEIGIDN